MDYFSHGFWSYIFFHKIEKPWLAVIFGLLPDSLSWLIYTIYRIVFKSGFGRPMLDNIPDWVFMLYNISHSLIIAGTAILIVYLIVKKFPVFMLAWPIAITMDFLTHTREFLPTPFLWPLSSWTFPGISWGNGTFMTINYSLIIICLSYIIWKKKKSK